MPINQNVMAMAHFADKPERECAWFNLNSIVREFVSDDSNQAPDGIKVETELGSNMAKFWGDAELIRKLCRELGQNSIDSMPNGGRLSFMTRMYDTTAIGNTGQTLTQKPDHIGDSQGSTAQYANGHGPNWTSNVGHLNDMSDTSPTNRDDGKDTSDIDVAGSGSYLVLQVSDTGVGMDEQTKATMLQQPCSSRFLPPNPGSAGA